MDIIQLLNLKCIHANISHAPNNNNIAEKTRGYLLGVLINSSLRLKSSLYNYIEKQKCSIICTRKGNLNIDNFHSLFPNCDRRGQTFFRQNDFA